MTPRDILSAMPMGEPMSAKAIAKALGQPEASKILSRPLQALRDAGLVTMGDTGSNLRQWTRIGDLPPEPEKPADRYSVRVPVAACTWSSGERLYTSVSLPMPPWGAGEVAQ